MRTAPCAATWLLMSGDTSARSARGGVGVGCSPSCSVLAEPHACISAEQLRTIPSCSWPCVSPAQHPSCLHLSPAHPSHPGPAPAGRARRGHPCGTGSAAPGVDPADASRDNRRLGMLHSFQASSHPSERNPAGPGGIRLQRRGAGQHRGGDSHLDAQRKLPHSRRVLAVRHLAPQPPALPHCKGGKQGRTGPALT